MFSQLNFKPVVLQWSYSLHISGTFLQLSRLNPFLQHKKNMQHQKTAMFFSKGIAVTRKLIADTGYLFDRTSVN